MLEKARTGIFPSAAPVGYQNTTRPDGKRIITPHPEEAPIITMLFERFATGAYSIDTLAKTTRAEGVLLAGRPLYRSFLHQILRKRIYNGQFDWDGTTYQGTHEPLITMTTWETVQRLLNQRKEHQTKMIAKEFAYNGIITCGHCGLSMVAERKKGRYVYYHCTGHRGKHTDEPYTREETLTNAFASTLSTLVIPAPVLDWLQEELEKSETAEADARRASLKRYDQELKQLERRLDTLYEDRLNERITLRLYEEKSKTINQQLDAVKQRINELQADDREPLTKALDIVRLTSNAASTFSEQTPAEQRRLLTSTIAKATWQHGTLTATMLEPFEQLRRSNSLTSQEINRIEGASGIFEGWLPIVDSN